MAEREANEAAAEAPAVYEAVRRPDARRSFLDSQVRLADDDRVGEFVERAWRQQAPKRLTR